jgi:hypothetical protein
VSKAPKKGGHITRLSGLSQLTSRHPVVRGARGRRLEEIRDVDDLVVQFQSRPVRDVFEAPGLETDLPRVLYPLGEAQWVRYDADKDDPLTRSRRERDSSHDPDGRQGVWKPFIHKHVPRSGLYLYDAGRISKRQGVPLMVEWPSVVGWLGTFSGAAYINARGRVCRISARDGWSLWCFPGRDTMMAVPDPRKGKVKDLLFWKGGRLTVGWRGIEY